MGRLTLSANDRIKNSKEITTLIRSGQAFFLAPFKVYYTWESTTNSSNIRAAFAVPKKKFGKAVVRNRLKRLCRESFRLQKGQLVLSNEHPTKQLRVLFLYQKTQELNFSAIYTAIGDSIRKINKHG